MLNERKNKMYNVEMLKTLVKAGLKEKPEQASMEDWLQATGQIAPAVTAQATIIESTPWEASSSVGQAMVVAQPQQVVVAAQNPADAFVAKDSYSFDDFKPTGMNVDGILSLKNGSPFIGGKEILKKAFKATLLFGETKVKRTIKAQINGELKYFSTYGGGVDSRDGTPFVDKIAYCKRHDPKAFDYPSADLVFILDEDVTNAEGQVVSPKGLKVGHSTSATNRKVLEEFYNACTLKGIDTKSAEVPVKIGFRQMENKAKQIWTIVTVELA